MSRASLPQLAAEAKAGAAARLAVRTADAYYGYGDYAQAAELYRAALTKTGADPNLINLRLGMALARAGDKAGATAALNAVTGPRAELAKFWLVYLATRASDAANAVTRGVPAMPAPFFASVDSRALCHFGMVKRRRLTRAAASDRAAPMTMRMRN